MIIYKSARLSKFAGFTFFLLSNFFFSAIAQNADSSFLEFSPETYVVQKTDEDLIIDGVLNEESWQKAEWTNSFSDIQGDNHPSPRYNTKAKMLWDGDYFYIAAELEEPHVWATITEYDAVIFRENDFEVFIDPNGDTHHYYELEVNALGTVWDLMLTKPYRNNGKAIDAWDIKGLKTGIDIHGTLNNPADIDTGWTIELAIPWDVLEEASPEGPPEDGTQWRLNFSRVQWQTEEADGEYVKVKDPETGRELPEDNWSWSPQGIVNMHYPEIWGYVQFSAQSTGTENDSFHWKESEEIKWLMRRLYYRQAQFFEENERYTNDTEILGYEELYRSMVNQTAPVPRLTIQLLDNNYLMQLSEDRSGKKYYIRNDSKTWTN